MRRKKRTIPYDFESYRILTNEITEFNAENKEWPKYRYGTVTSSPWKYPNKVLKINYRIEFTSSMTANVEFAFDHPISHKPVKHAAEAMLGRFNGSPRWRIQCPIATHRWCWKSLSSLWSGKEEKLGCQNCGGVRRYAKVIETKIVPYRKDPSKITYILSKAGATDSQKKNALIALEKLSNKFKKMTDNYNVLTFSERQYYKKLRVLLFPSKKIRAAYMPSSKHGIPLPFQREF